jgi:hypothetical protein
MLDVNAFGDARTRAWAQRINDAQNTAANKGFEKAGHNHPCDAKANKTDYSKCIRDTAPPVEGRTTMNKLVGALGSGRWEAVA